jgi:hypothetical protein
VTSFLPTYPAPTQQMLRTGGVRAVVSKRVEDRERLLFLFLGVSCVESSNGRRTGLKEPLPSGVVGAVEASSVTFSSTSRSVVDKGFMVAVVAVRSEAIAPAQGNRVRGERGSTGNKTAGPRLGSRGTEEI